MSILFINYQEPFENTYQEIESLDCFFEGDVIMEANFDFYELLGFDKPTYSISYEKVLMKEYRNGTFHSLENHLHDNYHFRAFISKFSEVNVFYCMYSSENFFNLYKVFKSTGIFQENPLFVIHSSKIGKKISFSDFICKDEYFFKNKRKYFFNYFFESYVNKYFGFKQSLTDFLFLKFIDDLFQRLHHVPYYMVTKNKHFNFEDIQRAYDKKLLNNYEANNEVYIMKGTNFEREYDRYMRVSEIIGNIDPEEIFSINVSTGNDVKFVLDKLFREV